MTLSQYLKNRSEEICLMNGCTEEKHVCGSYAYINSRCQLMDICTPDFFQGSPEPHAAVALPWTGNQKELEKEVREQCAELEGDE